MSVWTADELATHIAAYKAALLALGSGAQEFTLDLGISKRTVKQYEISDLTKHLQYLQSELDTLSDTSVGRTYAKQGGRG